MKSVEVKDFLEKLSDTMVGIKILLFLLRMWVDAFSSRIEGFCIFMINWASSYEKCEIWRFSGEMSEHKMVSILKQLNFKKKGETFSDRTEDFCIKYFQ